MIYANEENGYTVLRLDTLDGGLTTVVGTLPSAYPGEELRAYGEWVTHPNHGRQFKAEYADRSLPRTAGGDLRLSLRPRGEGRRPATAALIVEKFGDKALDVIEREPARLTEIRGITPRKAGQISADFRRQSGLRRLMELLCSHSLRPLLAVRSTAFTATIPSPCWRKTHI